MKLKLLSSGYWHASGGSNYWAQWPKWREPTEEDVFALSWNASRFLSWWEIKGRRIAQSLLGGELAHECS